jgi:hypothetical protein
MVEGLKYSIHLSPSSKKIFIYEPESFFTSAHDNVVNSIEASGGSFLHIQPSILLSKNFYIVDPGDYGFSFRLSNQRPQESASCLILSIDGKFKSFLYSASPQFEWVDTGAVYLTRGSHQISIQALGDLAVDTFAIYNEVNKNFLQIFNVTNGNVQLKDSKMIDPGSYIVKVEAKEPFILLFHEGYDPNWFAITNDSSISSTPSYYCLNSFIIKPNKAGGLEIKIEYTVQNKFVNLWKISFSILLVVLFFLCLFKIKQALKRR